MLPLRTEATIEAMNVSTDRRHLFHTYNDRNRFGQFGFTQQNIGVDIDDMAISNGKGSLRHCRLRLQSMFLSDFDILIAYNSLIQQQKQTYLFLSYFLSPATIQTPVWLGRWSKNMYMDEPESWNYFAIDSLNRLLLEQSAAMIVSWKKNDAVGWQQFYCHTVSNRYKVFDVSCITL